MIGTRSPGAGACEDAEIVRRVRSGDREAYSELVERYQAMLYRYIRSLGPDHDTAMDIVQDAFIRGYMCLDQCRDGASVRAWLFRIGRNLCFDHQKNVRQRTVSLSDADGEMIDGRGAPESDLQTLRAALAALPPDLREAFLLRHDAGYTYEEAAGIVGATTSAVKMRVHRARRMLLAFLEPEREKDCDEAVGASRL
jgi:RNA polymerase sigma-70 factor (ECF subfamily)